MEFNLYIKNIVWFIASWHWQNGNQSFSNSLKSRLQRQTLRRVRDHVRIHKNCVVSSFLSGRAHCLGTFSSLCMDVCAQKRVCECVCVCRLNVCKLPLLVLMTTDCHRVWPWTNGIFSYKNTPLTPHHADSCLRTGDLSCPRYQRVGPKRWATLGRTSSSLLRSALSSSPAGTNLKIRMLSSIRSVPSPRKLAFAKSGRLRWVC